MSQPAAPPEPEQPSPTEQQVLEPEIPASPTPIQAELQSEPAPTESLAPEPVTESIEQPEIREVGSQLAELKTDAASETERLVDVPAEETHAEKPQAEEEEEEAVPLASNGSAESENQIIQS
jgi:hypothetical protein